MSPTVVRRKWCPDCHHFVPVAVTMLTVRPPDFRREVAWLQAADREIEAEFQRQHVPNCEGGSGERND